MDRALRRLNLGFYQDKQAKSLSGGNKRKLSTAIALVGDPPLLYMVSEAGRDSYTRDAPFSRV